MPLLLKVCKLQDAFRWYGLVPRVQEQCLLIFPVLADFGAHMLAALFLRM